MESSRRYQKNGKASINKIDQGILFLMVSFLRKYSPRIPAKTASTAAKTRLFRYTRSEKSEVNVAGE